VSSEALAVPIGDPDRERAADLLERACGEGRLTLEEFRVRVGALWPAGDPNSGSALARWARDFFGA
jgi:hypothetical protein